MTLVSFLFTALLISPTSCTAVIAPQSSTELHHAVDACIKLSPVGDCSKGPHGPIGSWNVSAVTDMSLMFYNARSFNQDLSAWDVSAVTDMSWMFAYAQSFNQDLSTWDVSAVTDMSQIFSNAQSFNQHLSAWNVSAVTDMSYMFDSAHSFNQHLSVWDVSAVTRMNGMFGYAHSFNQDLSVWDVSAVTRMNGMFGYAHSFNQDLSVWDVSAVTNMIQMFQNAISFDQILCGVFWVNSKAKKDNMFTGSSGSISLTVCTSTTTTAVTTTTANTVISTTTTTVTATIIAITATSNAVTSTITTTPTATTTATIVIAAIAITVIICVVVVIILIRANSNKSGGGMKMNEMPLLRTNEIMMSNTDPVFASPATETDPNTTVTEQQSSNPDPVFTSPTAEADPSTTVVEEKTSSADPVLTSPTTETDPNTTVTEQQSSTTDPVFTSPTAEADPSTTVMEAQSSTTDPVLTSVTNDNDPITTTALPPERTFATSNYKRFYADAMAVGLQHNLLSAVETVLTLYGKRISATEEDRMFVEVEVLKVMIKIQDDAFKDDEAMKKDVSAMAEYLWTSSKTHRICKDMSLCSVLNTVIRDDVADEIEAATIIFRSINSRRIRRGNVHANMNVQSYPSKGETWRGGGFRREHRAFFERMIGKKYRVPGFLATSLRREIAAAFAFKADMANPSHPCAMWRITFDQRGKDFPEYRVRHMTLVSKTLVKGEHEYLFAPYSVFTLVSVKWSVKLIESHQFTVQAARDNREEDECLPLSPWY